MKLAIVILCHRLTEALEYSIEKFKDNLDVFVVIHVDKKVALSKFSHLEGSNVFLLPNRVEVNWGAFGQIESTLNCFRWLQNNDIEFDYVSLISGDDVPLQPIKNFMDYLDQNKGTEFIGVQKSAGEFYDPSDRVRYRYPNFFFSKKASLSKIMLVYFFKFFSFFGFYRNKTFEYLPRCYKGSSWFTISCSAMSYVLNFLESNDTYENTFLDSYCTDEVFFQTILMNSPFRENINCVSFLDIDDNEASLRYIDWRTGPDYPKNLDINDIRAAKRKAVFFARKVSEGVSLSDLNNALG